jgi:transcriptional regulator with GAF, ATPase, and Fis domain
MKESTIQPATGSSEKPAFSTDRDLFTLRSHRTRAEIYAIRQALEQTGWIRKRAARLLAISYRSLLYKIQRHKITRETPAAGDAEAYTAQPQSAAQN